jgi:hypothetical protein
MADSVAVDSELLLHMRYWQELWIGPSEGPLQGAARRLLTCRVAVRFLSEMRHWEAPGEG